MSVVVIESRINAMNKDHSKGKEATKKKFKFAKCDYTKKISCKQQESQSRKSKLNAMKKKHNESKNKTNRDDNAIIECVKLKTSYDQLVRKYY